MPETNSNNVFCVVPMMDALQSFPTHPPSGIIVVQNRGRDRIHIIHSVEQCQRVLHRLPWLSGNRRGEMLEEIETVSLFASEEPPEAITISGAEAALLSEAMNYYHFVIEGSEEHLPYPFEKPAIISIRLPAKGVRGGAVLGIHDRGPSVHIVYSRKDVRTFVESYPHSDGKDGATRIHRLDYCGLPETSKRSKIHITGYAARTLLLALVVMSALHHPPIVMITLSDTNGTVSDFHSS